MQISVTAFPTIKAFVFLNEQELFEPPPLPLESPPPDELSEELLEQESIRPKANTRIVGKKSNFSFFIESQVCAGQIIVYSN